MKFRMNFGTVKNIILWAVAVAAAAIFVLDIVMLCITSSASKFAVAVFAVSLVGSAFLWTQCLVILFNSRYVFTDERLTVVLGVFRDKVAYKDIIVLRQNSKTGDLFMFVNGATPKDGQISVHINLKGQSVDLFVEELRRHVSELAIEMFTVQKS